MISTGFQFTFASETTPHQLAAWLHQNYSIDLSQRKLKHLSEHGWMGARWGVIPWGFFQPMTTASSRVLYEDDACLAVYKPPFVTVVGPNLHQCLLGFWKKRIPSLTAVHRLDFETSGIVLFAKTTTAKTILDRAFRQREVEKTYEVLVHGQPTQTHWVRNTPMLSRSGHMVQAAPRTPKKLTLSAETEFNCLQTWKTASGKLVTCLEAKPKTGRRHQIRAHAYWSGYPVVGEAMYGGVDVVRMQGVRLQLHAKQLSVKVGKHRIQVDCPLPPDMMRDAVLGLTHD